MPEYPKHPDEDFDPTVDRDAPPLTEAEAEAVDEAAREELDLQVELDVAKQLLGLKPKDYYLLVETKTDVWERHVGLTKVEARELRPWLRGEVKAGRLETFTLERADPELYAVGVDDVKAAITNDLYPSEREPVDEDSGGFGHGEISRRD